MSSEYVGIYDDGTGGVWFLIRAHDKRSVMERFPQLQVFSLEDAPSVERMNLDRLRAFVAPGVDPLEPVRDRSASAQEEFLKYRDEVRLAMRERDESSGVPQSVISARDRAPSWVDLDDSSALVDYLRSLPPSASK